MNAAVGGQTHEVYALAVLLCVGVSIYHFGVAQDGAVSTCAVDFYQVLVNDATGADLQVAHFGVTQLSVGQTHVLARSEELRVRIVGSKAVHEGSRCLEDDVAFSLRANSPTIENHK